MRARRREFLAEGPQAVREALRRRGCVRRLFATTEALQRHDDIAAAAGDHEVVTVDAAAIDTLAGSVTPQGLVAVCGFLDVSLVDALGAAAALPPSLVVVGAQLRDPGNAGALIRCADAVGADVVVLAGDSVDPYNDKVVRSSAGSIFHLPLVLETRVGTAIESIRARGVRVLAADGGGPVGLDALLDDGSLSRPTAWLFGNEAWGIPADQLERCDATVAVPIYGGAESLNVASAAAVCLYATARAQRHRDAGASSSIAPR